MTIDPFSLPAEYQGPFERAQWPERITAHVVAPGGPGDDPRIAGYAVAADLARFHGMVDVAWLTLRGELPAGEQRAALDTALVLLAPVHIGEAPAHAALLGRMAGAGPAATLAIGALALGELAEHEAGELAPWLAWLDGGGAGPVPEVALTGAAEPAARAAQRALDLRMRGWFGAGGGLPDVPLRRIACAHAILFRLGVRDALTLATVATWARLPAVVAEAAHARAGVVRDYPSRLPDYQYVDDRGAAP